MISVFLHADLYSLQYSTYVTAAGASGSDCISSFYEEKNRYLFPMLAFLQEEGVNIGVRIQELHFNINLTVQTHAHQLPHTLVL